MQYEQVFGIAFSWLKTGAILICKNGKWILKEGTSLTGKALWIATKHKKKVFGTILGLWTISYLLFDDDENWTTKHTVKTVCFLFLKPKYDKIIKK